MNKESLRVIIAIILSGGVTPSLSHNKNRILSRNVRTIYQAEVRTPPQMAMYNGYPSETHHVTTEDGYILEMHRIPFGRKDSTGKVDRPPALLMHCFFCSSSDWLLNYPEDALGYVLADKGYDVWMTNARGNVFSRNHTTLSPSSLDFWNFSFHEIGVFDIPASIDYILKATNTRALHYVGYSMGVASLFAMLSEKPEYNAKIKVAAMLGPATYLTHSQGTAFKFSSLVNVIENVAERFGIQEILTQNAITNIFGATTCSQENSFLNEFCRSLISIIIDVDGELVNQEFLPVILSHIPAGGSLKTILHFMQVKNADRFQMYDFGRDRNQKFYGNLRPPKYDLRNVKISVGLFFSKGDLYVSYKDVQRLASELPNVVLKHEIQHPKFSHFDFVWARNLYGLLYKDVVAFLDAF